MAKRPKGHVKRLTKALLFRMIGYSIYADEVRRMHESDARVKIISAPARTSKSYSAAADVMGDGVFPDFLVAEDGSVTPIALPNGQNTRLIWIVAPDFSLAKEFDYLFTWLVDNRNRYGFGYEVETAQNNPAQGAMKIQISWGKDIHGSPIRTLVEAKSSKNERSLQAEEVYRVLLSEAADQEERVWAKYISTRYGKAIWPTTPKVRADWIRKVRDEAAVNPRMLTESFDYDGRCNPGYDWQRYWIEHAKAESRQAAVSYVMPEIETEPPADDNGHDCFAIGDQCYASRDPHFAEQFMGRWTYAEQRVLPFRWRDEGIRRSHVLHTVPPWIEHADKYIAVDYGYTDPAAAGWFAVDADGTIVLFREFYQKGVTADKFAEALVAVNRDSRWKIRSWLADPRKPEVMRHFNRLGLPVLRVDKNRQSDRQAGTMALSDLLSDDPVLGRPKFFVMNTCPHTIDEFKLLRRKDNHTGDEYSTAAFVGADHMFDLTRYFVTSYPRGESYESKLARERGDSIFEMARKNELAARMMGLTGLRRSAAGGVPGMVRNA